MTEGKLQKIIDLRKAITICECVIGDLQEGVWGIGSNPKHGRGAAGPAADGFGRFS